jgi:hypothetical protein
VHFAQNVTLPVLNLWWLGCVLSINETIKEVKNGFVHPHGPSPSYIFPRHPAILWIHQSGVSTKMK